MVSPKLKIAVLVVSAGSGSRFGGDTPKQYLPLRGKPVVQWSLDAFRGVADAVAVVVNPAHDHPAFGAGIIVAAGGATRQESVRNGLAALRAEKPDIVLIHDAARPLVSQELIARLIAAAARDGAAVPALPVTDSVRRDGKPESREGLVTVQAPQAFRFALIDALHQKYKDASVTDDAALCDLAGRKVTLVEGQQDNIKITLPGDIERAEQLLALRRARRPATRKGISPA